MPHLRKGQSSENIDMRQGVCLGLAEILAAASRKQVEEYLDILVQALQQSLCDASAQVRQQAGRAFLTLFKAIGEPAVQEVRFKNSIHRAPIDFFVCNLSYD